MSYPLDGIRVLDLSRVLAGPFASRLLSDLGADVVKVEPPEGDLTRIWGKLVGGVPGYFHQQNVGKRDICIDMSGPDGVALTKRLVMVSDVVIENFRPGVMDRLGLGYETLKAMKSDIIMLSISGFGHGGPESLRAAYAPIIHAESGLVSRQARGRGKMPTDIGMSVADTNASLHGLVALLSALLMRERTAAGQHIDIAMIDAMIATDDQLHYYLEDSHDTGPALSDIWETGAGSVLLAGDFRHIWRQLNTKMGLDDPTPPGAALEEKIRCRREAAATFFANLEDWEVVGQAMQKMNLAWGAVRAPEDIGESATVRHRGSLAKVDDRAGGKREVPQSPYRFSDAESGVRGGAPHRGEHNEEILREWLEMDDVQVREWLACGVMLSEVPG